MKTRGGRPPGATRTAAEKVTIDETFRHSAYFAVEAGRDRLANAFTVRPYRRHCWDDAPVTDPPPDRPAPRSGRATGFTSVDYAALTWVLSLGAAIIHLAVAPIHFREATVSGVFFIVAACFQTVTAFIFRRAHPKPLLAVVFLLNAGLIGVWAWSRATGLPVGPSSGQREAVGLADVVATMYELGIVWVVLRLWWIGPAPSTRLRDASSSTRLIVSMFVWTTLGAIIAAPH